MMSIATNRQTRRSCGQTDSMRRSLPNRLTEQSPLGFYGGDTNLYRYVGDDPTSAIDPLGLKLVIGNNEIKDATDQTYRKIIDTLLADKTLKNEADTAQEILDGMIKSKVEKKTYTYESVEELMKAIKLRLYVIIAAKGWAKAQKEGRLVFPKPKDPLISFAGSPLIESTTVKMTINALERELRGIRLKGGSPSKAIEAMRAAKKGNPVVADCASTVALAILTGLRDYLGADAFDRLFNKEKPFVIAGPYGLNRFLIPPKGKADFLPGGTKVFTNEGATNPVFENENTIYLGGGEYYAPGIGIMKEADLQRALNKVGRGLAKPDEGMGQVIVPMS